MTVIDIILTGIGLACDAIAVSMCKGLLIKKMSFNKIFTIAFYFGMFQCVMPILGYLFGTIFTSIIVNVDHWIAFVLLSIIGINMIWDGISNSDEYNDKTDFGTMFPLAIATSIDALTVGITFSFFKMNIFFSSFLIGLITFVLSFVFVLIGYNFGLKYHRKSQMFGGLVLIVIGIKILFEHLW